MTPRQALSVNGTACRKVRLAVSPQSDFRAILHAFDSIDVPPVPLSYENIKFAILELVNNSIRAHQEASEPRDILIDLGVSRGALWITVRDFGGGFDPKRLPYNLEESTSALDLHSRSFQEYQEKNGYRKFGMGIYIAKKTFDRFRLEFLDKRDLPVPWIAGRIVGTRITLELFLEGVPDEL